MSATAECRAWCEGRASQMHVQFKCRRHGMRGCSEGDAVEALSCRCLRSICVLALPAAAGDVTCCSAAAHAGGIQGVAEEEQPKHTSALLHSFAILDLLPQVIGLRHAINTAARISLCAHIKCCEACSCRPPHATREFAAPMLHMLPQAALFVAVYTQPASSLFYPSSSLHNVKSARVIVLHRQPLQ